MKQKIKLTLYFLDVGLRAQIMKITALHLGEKQYEIVFDKASLTGLTQTQAHFHHIANEQ